MPLEKDLQSINLKFCKLPDENKYLPLPKNMGIISIR
jgi:hypothetical protein